MVRTHIKTNEEEKVLNFDELIETFKEKVFGWIKRRKNVYFVGLCNNLLLDMMVSLMVMFFTICTVIEPFLIAFSDLLGF